MQPSSPARFAEVVTANPDGAKCNFVLYGGVRTNQQDGGMIDLFPHVSQFSV